MINRDVTVHQYPQTWMPVTIVALDDLNWAWRPASEMKPLEYMIGEAEAPDPHHENLSLAGELAIFDARYLGSCR
jgi:hypothetical protein